MNRGRGLVQLYTGDGKGKTTAAIGQAIRAAGNNFKICFAFFFKDFEKHPTGESQILENLGITLYNVVLEYPWNKESYDYENIRQECLHALYFVKNKIYTENFDLVILDEINIALRDKFLTEDEIIDLIQKKPKQTELILTGRGATEKIIQEADLVSKIEKIKHPFDQGIGERVGIEY
jgi:cob(I)alamin adenosyltransferase